MIENTKYKRFGFSDSEIKQKNLTIQNLKASGDSCKSCSYFTAQGCKLTHPYKKVSHYNICEFHSSVKGQVFL